LCIRDSLPAELRGLVTDVEGLDTTQAPRPLATRPSASTVIPSCIGPTRLKSRAGGFLPADLADPGAYGHGALLSAGYDGDGESVAFVEFSNYKPADVAVYQGCFGTSVPVVDVPVAGGTRLRYGALEVALDLQTAISAAPGMEAAYVYVAPPTLSMAAVINQIVADRPHTGVTAVSISWGRCERLIAPARTAATAQALQLAAAAGMSVFVASGDSGSLDCFGILPASVDDPASQPFATGVGGTVLQFRRTGAEREITWNGAAGASGGGISRFWPKPSWQAGQGVVSPLSSGVPCGAAPGLCRQVPDVALNAASGSHGYIVYCTSADCGGAGWMTVGGTSAAAPLLAGITADMNEYSRAHGGGRLGFASPFLYQTFAAHPEAFHDVTLGDNQPGPGTRFPATPGYDMATGVGSVDAVALAAQLAAFTGAAPAPETTFLSGSAGAFPVSAQRPFTAHGQLADGGGPLVGARVWLQIADRLGIREWSTRTGASGEWTFTVRAALEGPALWRAVYLGDEAHQPALLPARRVILARP
jgi:subtilase family serine protease